MWLLFYLCYDQPDLVYLNNKQIITLMGVNVFSLVFGFSALLANGIRAAQAVTLTYQQVILHSSN